MLGEVVEANERLLQDGDVVLLGNAYDQVNAQVTLAGRVVSPGRYPFHPGMKLSELLKLGDGFLIDSSLERVLVERRLGVRRPYDIRPDDEDVELRSELIWIYLPALLAGDPQADLALQRLDKVTVFPETAVRDIPRVTIMGAIRKPGTYDLSSGMRVSDLLRLAGNTTADAFSGQSMVVRRRRAEDGRHLDVKLIPFDLQGILEGCPDCDNPPLANFDQVVIRRVQALQVEVSIDGRVQFPGTYILPEGSKITDLIRTAGGLLPEADMRSAFFSRESVRRHQIEHLTDMEWRSREHFTRVRDRVTRDGHYNETMANQLSLQGLGTLNSNARRHQATGRIVLDFMRQDFPGSTDNLSLENGDSLTVPRRRNTVAVLGRVFKPNAFICRSGEEIPVGEYIDMAGGLQDDADKKQFYELLASGEVHSAVQTGHRSLLKFIPAPGDRRRSPRRDSSRLEPSARTSARP